MKTIFICPLTRQIADIIENRIYNICICRSINFLFVEIGSTDPFSQQEQR